MSLQGLGEVSGGAGWGESSDSALRIALTGLEGRFRRKGNL